MSQQQQKAIATYQVSSAIALGSNLGQSLTTVEQAVKAISQHQNIELLAQSSWYRTKAIGPPQPDYINGCITLMTCLSPEALLQLLLEIENQFGRERQEHWGARTLDLDLILYGRDVIQLPHLNIPHPLMRERAFVLIPLAEIAPHWLDPITNLTIETLSQNCNNAEVQPLSQY